MATNYIGLIPTVRLLAVDTATEPEQQLFTDYDIIAFLVMYAGNERLAAARALRTIAASEVLISKKITTQDLSTDGAAVSAELRALADDLEREAKESDAGEGLDAYAAYVPGPGHYNSGGEGEEWVY